MAKTKVATKPAPRLSDIDLEALNGLKMTTNAKSDPPVVTDLIRVAKFSPDEKEREQARHYLAKIYKRLINAQVNGYVRKGTAGKGVRIRPGSAQMRQSREDLVSAAWLGFFNALDRFDPDSGVPFRGYFHFQVRHNCTKEFTTLTTHFTGLEGKAWKAFLNWIGTQNNKDISRMTWDQVLERASLASGVPASEINDAVLAKTGGNGNVVDTFSEREDEDGSVTLPISNDVICESYEWQNSDPGKPDRGVLWDAINHCLEQMSNSEIKPTRIQAAKKVCAYLGGVQEPEQIEAVAKNREFRSLFKKHVSSLPDAKLAMRQSNPK